MELGVVPQHTRGMQILTDMQRRKPWHWIALDDGIEDWPPLDIGNLIACDKTTKLSDREAHQQLMQGAAP